MAIVILDVGLTRIYMTKKMIMPNGLKVVATEKPGFLTSISVHIKGGSRAENKAQKGVAHFLEHLIFKGSDAFPLDKSLELAMDSCGGVEAVTTHEYTLVFARFFNDRAEQMLKIISSMIFRPIFTTDSVRKEKGAILEEMRKLKDDVDEYVDDEFMKFIWGEDSPFSFNVGGSEEDIIAVTREKCLDYHKKYFVPENIILSIVGGINSEEVFRLVNKYFVECYANGCLGHAATFSKLILPASRGDPVCVIEDNLEQAIGMLGGLPREWISFDKNYEERKNAAYLLMDILGGCPSARIYSSTRGENGLVYYVSAGINVFEDAGNFVISLGAVAGNLPKALEIVFGEMALLLKNGITGEEIQRSKYSQRLIYAEIFENSLDAAKFLGRAELRGLDITDINQYFYEKVDPINRDDIMDIAKDLFDKEKLKLVVVGMPESSEPIFQKMLAV